MRIVTWATASICVLLFVTGADVGADIFVANTGSSSVVVFADDGTGSIAPERVIHLDSQLAGRLRQGIVISFSPHIDSANIDRPLKGLRRGFSST